MERNRTPADAVRTAYEHLMGGRFEASLAALAGQDPARPEVRLLAALALAGSGDVDGAAPKLAAIAAGRPEARHPVLDLVKLVDGPAAGRHLRAAAALRPGDVGVLAALGAHCAAAGPMAEAAACFERVVSLAPGDAAGWSNWGKALAALGRFEAADAAFRRARGLAPGDARWAYHHGVMLLKAERWAEGWAAFAARHRLPGRGGWPSGRRLADLDVAGRTVLLVHDEGFGDTLQFIRYAAPLAALGARVVAAVPPALVRVVRTATGVAEVAALPVWPAFDVWAPLLDVPGLFGAPVAGAVPYLRAEAPAPALPPGRLVGLVWAGDRRGLLDAERSMPLEAVEGLRSVPGVVWVSLQKDGPAPGWCVDPMAGVRDFADTAAIVERLEAVVTVDTAVAHLAGALGRRVLLMDRYDNCWRWGWGRGESAWYPGTEIIRQERPGDWAGVVGRVAARLGGPAGEAAGGRAAE